MINTPGYINIPITKLKEWNDLLLKDGINSKWIVRTEIGELITDYKNMKEKNRGKEYLVRQTFDLKVNNDKLLEEFYKTSAFQEAVEKIIEERLGLHKDPAGPKGDKGCEY